MDQSDKAMAMVPLDRTTPEPELQPEAALSENNQPTPAATSVMQLPEATAVSTPKVKPEAAASSSRSPKNKPKPTAQSKTLDHKRVDKPAKSKGTTARSPAAAVSSAKAKTKAGSGKIAPSQAHLVTSDSTESNSYGSMLHDRFYKEWVQPTTVVASGAKFSATVKIRIDKDGQVSEFKLVRASGNVVVDESIEDIGKRVTRVDALPASLAASGHYDVNINFELNAEN